MFFNKYTKFTAVLISLLLTIGLVFGQISSLAQSNLDIDETITDSNGQLITEAGAEAGLTEEEELEKIIDSLDEDSESVVVDSLLVKVTEDEEVEKKERVEELVNEVATEKDFFEDLLGGFSFGRGSTKNNQDVESVKISENDDTLVFDLPDDVDLTKTIEELSQNEDIEIVQPIYNYKHFYTPDDPFFDSNQWYLKDQASGINLETGWDVIGASAGVSCGETTLGRQCGGDPSVKIAVIDSGVNTAVTDFAGANFDTAGSMMFYNQNDNTCPSGEYYQSFNIGGNFINFCQRLGSQFDEIGHGTKVTSIIGMQDNNIGGLGVAYNTTILPIAVHGAAFNTFFIAESIRYAAANGADVINMSLGTPFYDSYLEDAINEVAAQGVIMVAASGNCAVWTGNCDWDGNGFQTPNYFAEIDNAVMYPAGFGNVIAVGASDYGATTSAVNRSSYSNFGNHIDIVAPVGDGSPSPSNTLIQCGVSGGVCANNNSFVLGQGTSYASPQVAGGIGLMLSVDDSLSLVDIRTLFAIQSTEVGLAGKDSQFGHGILNIGNYNASALDADLADEYADIYWYNSIGGQNHIHLLNQHEIKVGTNILDTVNPASGWRPEIIADYNADGIKDVLWRRPVQGDTHIWLLNAEGVKIGTVILDIVKESTGWKLNNVGDFDGDGNTDVLWRRPSTGETHAWKLNSSGQKIGTIFMENVKGFTGWSINTIGDFNGDGTSDIFWRRPLQGDTHIWLMNSLGQRFSTSILDIVKQSSGWEFRDVGDFDGDNNLDVLWRNPNSGDTHVWILDTSASKAGTYVLDNVPGFTGWSVKDVEDFNDDGVTDIVWRRPVQGDTHIWKMSNTGTKNGTIILDIVPESSGWKLLSAI